MELQTNNADFSVALDPDSAAPVLAVAVPRARNWPADLAELAKLRLNFLVLVTTMVGYSMVPAVDWHDWRRLLHTLIGTALTAASASILNQLVERSWDGLM